MPTLQQLAADLTGQIPGLPNNFARKFVNRGYEEIRKDRLWSWDIGEGILIIPPVFTGIGTCVVTQYSELVQFDATAQAGLLPLVLGNPPLIKYQFRIANGPVYNITAYNVSTGVMSLDRIYMEQTTSGSSMFQIYRCYYDPPSTDGIQPYTTDFLRYLSILNNVQGYTITGRRLYLTREALNRRDPLRGAQGQPYYVAQYKPNSAGLMMSELWPHPTFNQALLCQYQKLHVDLQPNQELATQCPAPLVFYRTLEYGYRWAMQNSQRIPELRGVDWRFLLAESQKTYARELVAAKRNDNEIMLQIFKPGIANMYDFLGPIDSNYWQSHGLPAL